MSAHIGIRAGLHAPRSTALQQEPAPSNGNHPRMRSLLVHMRGMTLVDGGSMSGTQQSTRGQDSPPATEMPTLKMWRRCQQGKVAPSPKSKIISAIRNSSSLSVTSMAKTQHPQYAQHLGIVIPAQPPIYLMVKCLQPII